MKKLVTALKVFAVAVTFLPIFVFVAAPRGVSAATFTSQICQPASNGSGSITQCVNNIYIVAVAAAGFGGVVLFAYAGYLYIVGTSDLIARAKKIMTSVIIGMLILFGTYAILNTINPNLTNLAVSIPTVSCNGGGCVSPTTPSATIGFSIAITGAATGNPARFDLIATLNGTNCTTATCGTYSFAWKQDGTAIAACPQNFTCPSLAIPAATFQAQNNQSSIAYTATGGGQSYGSAACTLTPTSKPGACGGSSGSVPPVAGGASCLFSSINYCLGRSTDALGNANQCGAPVCSQYSAAIQNVASTVGGFATANVLKAIIYKESGCQISAGNSGGQAYGLMQLQVPTASNVAFDTPCGVNSSNVNQAWLQNPANAQASICIGAEYLNSLAPSCGSNLADLLAGYSGGSVACSPSVDCTQQTGCDGSPMRKWECLYDDTAHQTCNGNNTVLGSAAEYNETRNAVMTKLYCVSNPGF